MIFFEIMIFFVPKMLAIRTLNWAFFKGANVDRQTNKQTKNNTKEKNVLWKKRQKNHNNDATEPLIPNER